MVSFPPDDVRKGKRSTLTEVYWVVVLNVRFAILEWVLGEIQGG